MRAGRDQVSVQDRVHLVLDPRAVPDDLVTPCHQSAQALGIRIRQPDFGQEIGGPQRCQYAGIDLVGLDVRMCNCLDLQRIGQNRHRAISKTASSAAAAHSALPRDQSPCPLGMNWKSPRGTCSKNALCSLCWKGHRTGVGCWLVYQFLHPPTQTVPGKAVPRRATNLSVAAAVGATAAERARASPMSRVMQAISWSRPNGTGTLFTGANG